MTDLITGLTDEDIETRFTAGTATIAQQQDEDAVDDADATDADADEADATDADEADAADQDEQDV